MKEDGNNQYSLNTWNILFSADDSIGKWAAFYCIMNNNGSQKMKDIIYKYSNVECINNRISAVKRNTKKY